MSLAILVGVLFGLALGVLAVRLLRAVDDYQVEILATLALVSAGYAAARHLHVSGVLGMVVLGLVIGQSGRAVVISRRSWNLGSPMKKGAVWRPIASRR